MSVTPSIGPEHFQGKEAVGHVAMAQAQGILMRAEGHGQEPSGYLSAAADAARDTALLFALFWILLHYVGITAIAALQADMLLCCGWLFWRMGRSGWLGWSRLERLHRVVQEEKWEIEHHRKQEREELKVLYGAKGFEGKLLEDVLDVLMADGDRLLRVMVEEELGLSLGQQEHPLQQAFAAGVGAGAAILFCALMSWAGGEMGAFLGALATGIASSLVVACQERNRLISAAVWTSGLMVLSLATVYFLVAYLQPVS